MKVIHLAISKILCIIRSGLLQILLYSLRVFFVFISSTIKNNNNFAKLSVMSGQNWKFGFGLFVIFLRWNNLFIEAILVDQVFVLATRHLQSVFSQKWTKSETRNFLFSQAQAAFTLCIFITILVLYHIKFDIIFLYSFESRWFWNPPTRRVGTRTR